MINIAALLALLGSPAGADVRIGDCNYDGRVSVGELILGVNMALGNRALVDCPAFDRDGNAKVEIGELIAAVGIALGLSPATPAATTAAPPSQITETASPTLSASVIPTPTTVEPSGCDLSAIPPSFGAGFVDLTTEIELDLVPVAPARSPGQPTKTLALFNDVDNDGVMEVLIGQDVTAPVSLLRYDTSSKTLRRDSSVALPTFAWFLGVIDIDSDGISDLFGGRDGPAVSWGLGGGAFAEPAHVFPEPEGPYGFYFAPYFGDFDSDGWLDFIAEGGEGCEEGQAVRVLFAAGNRKWVRRDEILPTSQRIGDGLMFIGPLAGVENVAAILGKDCGPLLSTPRFYVPALDAADDGYPVWQPQELLVHYSTEFADPLFSPMGAAVADLDGDGRFEFSITGDPVLGTWHGADSAPMPNVTEQTGMMLAYGDRRLPQIPWAVLHLDLDRDGRLDTFVTHGTDYAAAVDGRIGPQWSTAYWNAGGLCTIEISDQLHIIRPGDWRTLAVGDLEGDGLPDLAVGGLGEQPRILHNDIETGNHGFGLRLRGTTSNRYGIGARIEVEVSPGTPIQHHLVGGFYPPYTIVEPLVFVGLGSALVAQRVSITWPSGTVQILRDVAAGALHTIDEPAVITIEPPGRHLAADGASIATIHVTPRDEDGAVRTDATVSVEVVTGAASLKAPPEWNGSEWRAGIEAPGDPGSSVIAVTVDGKTMGVRPRIWFD